jgi:beta-ketoacyl-acyl-carrier-protein synthase II
MELTYRGRQRVVITGMGALTPLGELKKYWENLLAGKSGIRRITQFDPEDIQVKIAAEVDFEPREHIPPKEARRMSISSQQALVAARMALQDAGLSREELVELGDRASVVIGTVNAGFSLLLDGAYDFTFRGRRPLPLTLINGLPNMPGHYISSEMGASGALETISTACASGTQSIGAAAELIRTGRADLVFAGGVDNFVRKEIIAAFDAMTVLVNNYNDRPEQACRPFEANRSGFVMGEGAGMIVLESLEQAVRRGARIYVEVAGHASSSDAYHSAAPDSEGLGALKAMRWALEDACLNTDEVGYINAHGTGTRVNDATETKAIKGLFGSRAYKIPVSSTKSMIGHCMGAAGTLEAIATVMSLHQGVLHPTINYDTPDPECDLDYVPNMVREADIQVALSNSFGLGGQNACLVFMKLTR